MEGIDDESVSSLHKGWEGHQELEGAVGGGYGVPAKARKVPTS